MARRKARADVHKIHLWTSEELERAAAHLINVILDESKDVKVAERENSQLLMSLILNEAHRRREMQL